jgi:hypothetical protein
MTSAKLTLERRGDATRVFDLIGEEMTGERTIGMLTSAVATTGSANVVAAVPTTTGGARGMLGADCDLASSAISIRIAAASAALPCIASEVARLA